MISLVGDRTDIPAKLRLMIQFVAAGFTSWAIVLIHLGFSSFQGVSVLLCILLISFYLVITANVYNFMDGIDGLAGITAFIAFSLLAVTGWYRGETMVTVILSAVISSASLGFLFWNFPKAKVFMGDVGSIFLVSSLLSWF
jgi:Fuc2NAc and GlcNAc transferase